MILIFLLSIIQTNLEINKKRNAIKFAKENKEKQV